MKAPRTNQSHGKQPRFRPRNFTALGLCLIWLLISLFFISQGAFVLFWSIFAVCAALIGIAALWLLFTE